MCHQRHLKPFTFYSICVRSCLFLRYTILVTSTRLAVVGVRFVLCLISHCCEMIFCCAFALLAESHQNGTNQWRPPCRALDGKMERCLPPMRPFQKSVCEHKRRIRPNKGEWEKQKRWRQASPISPKKSTYIMKSQRNQGGQHLLYHTNPVA